MLEGFSPRAQQRLLKQVGVQVTGILETTRDTIRDDVQRGLQQGLGGGALGDLIEDSNAFSEYRGELIARTETAIFLNRAATETYRDYGVTHVEVIDGTDDEECADANGQTWTLEEAEANPIAHPNCVRDFVPIIGDVPATEEPPTEEGAAPVSAKDTEAYQRALTDPAYRSVGDARSDQFMTDMGKEMGFGGLPENVTQAQLDRYIAQGEVPLWRGETAAKYADAFTSGEYRVGLGQYGNGIYTAYGPEAQATAEMFGRQSGSVLQMTLKADARVIDYAEASKRADLVAGTYNIGRWAMREGYDAIHVNYGPLFGQEGGEYVILNRTAVRVVAP